MELNDKKPRNGSIIVLSSLLLAGCSDDFRPYPEDTENVGRAALEFSVSINQASSTRADETGFADGDRMGVFVVSYEDGQAGTLTTSSNLASNAAYTFNASAGKWNSPAAIYWPDNETAIDVYGYYPFANAISNVNAYSFEVSKDQSVNPENGEMGAYEASDFLWAKAANAQPGNAICLEYQHLMSGVKVILTEGNGFEAGEFEKMTKTVTIDNTKRHANIDFSTGTVTATGDYDYNIIANPESGCYRAVVVPQTAESGKTTIGISLDGTNRPFTHEGEISYQSGKLYNFTIKIDKNSDTGTYSLSLETSSITEWEADHTTHDFEANSYVVVECNEAGKLNEALANQNIDSNTVKNLKIIGVLNDDDCILLRSMPSLSSLNIKETSFPRVKVDFDYDRMADIWGENAIPTNAFYGNKTIRRYVLPESIVEIGSGAFRETEPTSAILIPESVKKVGDHAFAYIWENGELILPSQLEYIGKYAFTTGAKFEMRLPNTLKHIDEKAFAGASNAYGTFSIPTNLEYLATDAFAGMGHDMIGDVDIPAGLLTSISFDVGFANGTNITLPEGLTKIERLAGKFNSPIILPQSLERIEGGAFYGTRFSAPIEFPSNLVYIGPSAFWVSTLTGKVEIPQLIDCVKERSFCTTGITEVICGDNVMQIEKDAFSNCGDLRHVELGKNIGFIGENAFGSCPQIQTLVSLAKEPAKATSAFNGCDFERTVLEVPTGCVDVYRNADGWKEFRNITEHRELSVDISEIQCLEKGLERTASIKAEGAWSVTACPDWVTITPNSGQAKDEITIKVSSQEFTADEREGTIEFTLTDKNYTTTVNVRQTKADEKEDEEITLQTASAKGKAIPLMIVGEGFTASQITSGRYMEIMKQTMDQFFDIEPYKSLKNHFTVVTAIACSPDEGVKDYYTKKQNKLDTYGVEPDETRLRDYVKTVSSSVIGDNMANAMVIVVNNYGVFDGWTKICDDGFTIASIGLVEDAIYPYDQRGLVQHHAGGAAFAGLGAEYVSHFDHIKSCKCPNCNALDKFNEMKAKGYYENLSLSGKINEAPWREFVFDENYSGNVDMWEGGYRHLRGVWRSESQSVMGTYISYYNAISRYAIYKRALQRAGLGTPTFEDFKEFDKKELPQ